MDKDRKQTMVKLTVLYDLAPGEDHEEFVKWRTTTHQQENMAMPGLIKTDFYIVREAWKKDPSPYRYMTESYFTDIETFKKTFFDPDYQARLAKWLEKLANPLFLFSEEVLSETVTQQG